MTTYTPKIIIVGPQRQSLIDSIKRKTHYFNYIEDPIDLEYIMTIATPLKIAISPTDFVGTHATRPSDLQALESFNDLCIFACDADDFYWNELVNILEIIKKNYAFKQIIVIRNTNSSFKKEDTLKWNCYCFNFNDDSIDTKKFFDMLFENATGNKVVNNGNSFTRSVSWFKKKLMN